MLKLKIKIEIHQQEQGAKALQSLIIIIMNAHHDVEEKTKEALRKYYFFFFSAYERDGLHHHSPHNPVLVLQQNYERVALLLFSLHQDVSFSLLCLTMHQQTLQKQQSHSALIFLYKKLRACEY